MVMKYLLPGMESVKRVELLLSLTRIDSESIKDAITDHLCDGHPEAGAALINGVPKQNLSRALDKLNKVAETVELIKNLDWGKLNQLSDDRGCNNEWFTVPM